MNQTKQEEAELERIGRMIRETPVRVDLEERIMSLANGGQPSGTKAEAPRLTRTGRVLRKSTGIAAAVLLLFLLITSTEWISPTLAASIKQIPGMDSIFRLAGDLGLRNAGEQGLAAVPELSDTHDGLTLTVPEVLYDGIRVSLGIERHTGVEKFRQGDISDLMTDIKLSINGEDINSYGPLGSGGGGSFGPFILRGKDTDSRIIQFTDLQNQGGRAFPDAFELTLTVGVQGIREPFVMKLPVVKKTYHNIIAEPIIRSSSGMTFSLETLELTPITTRITTRVENPADQPVQSGKDYLGYDLVDDQGNVLREINGGTGWNAAGGNIMVAAALFEPLEHQSSHITVKPFRTLSIDQEGNREKEYVPEFAVVVPVSVSLPVPMPKK
ncbi:DUF4179 domain-containing protein [Paenibacillus tritici]|uniref:DUF4179 domain-containing protein n=1 Tax=Paenibacillus tritici TaxID=1873425 RepID=A0ABX2DY05_9BACL|nr:DUF4179 domain-containing protein [Paenibacillus tritici]NQX49605.1 DUF4179 domain-containing protein [Paenibacillus tritici]